MVEHCPSCIYCLPESVVIPHDNISLFPLCICMLHGSYQILEDVNMYCEPLNQVTRASTKLNIQFILTCSTQ